VTYFPRLLIAQPTSTAEQTAKGGKLDRLDPLRRRGVDDVAELDCATAGFRAMRKVSIASEAAASKTQTANAIGRFGNQKLLLAAVDPLPVLGTLMGIYSIESDVEQQANARRCSKCGDVTSTGAHQQVPAPNQFDIALIVESIFHPRASGKAAPIRQLTDCRTRATPSASTRRDAPSAPCGRVQNRGAG
jgi:hypothetical protein